MSDFSFNSFFFAGDSFSYNDNCPFTTRDRDNDVYEIEFISFDSTISNIAHILFSAWWFREWVYDENYCSLNSPYGTENKYWTTLNGSNNYLLDTVMKIRDKNNRK